MESLPRRFIREWVLPSLPRKVRERIVTSKFAWSHKEAKVVATPGEGEVRLLIAPVNFASQAYLWARAAETIPGVSARNLVFGYTPQGNSNRPDVSIPGGAGMLSKRWAGRQREEIIKGFTHVLYEAERSILRAYYDGDLAKEVRDLQRTGVKVAFLSHGSDIRVPSEHVERERFSPFAEELDGLTEEHRTTTLKNRAILKQFDVPKYISTPDLSQYLDDTLWLPILANSKTWEGLPPSQLGKRKPVVLHVPSRSAIKGTKFISAAMKQLQEEGLIEYMEREHVPNAQMPELVGSADVVIDQLTMSLYGVSSVEAMLAGRVVVAQVGPFIRDYIREATGYELPIVEANPETIYEVVRDIALHPENYIALESEGMAFAHNVHSQQRAAKALEPFLFS